MNALTKNIILAVVVVSIAGSIFYLESQKVRPKAASSTKAESVQCANPGPDGTCTTTPAVGATGVAQMDVLENTKIEKEIVQSPEYLAKTKKYKRFVEISDPSGFINTNEAPLTIGELIGEKVILVDFWTYSCINCQRTFPYLTDWYAKYKDAGLEIVSIHTPEFQFEKKKENVTRAAMQAGIEYPIIQDNNYGTWRAYNNFYWPRKYIIDIDGFIVYDHIGEGGYTETEKIIQELLKERAERLGEEIVEMTTNGDVIAETVDASKPRTPEIYFGSLRNKALSNGKKSVAGTQTFTLPTSPILHALYLGGSWNITGEYSRPTAVPAYITLKYQGQKVFMVARSDTPVLVKVLIDGALIPEVMRGADVNAEGYATFQEDRLYRIVEDTVWGEHTLELIVESSGLEVFTFTFG